MTLGSDSFVREDRSTDSTPRLGSKFCMIALLMLGFFGSCFAGDTFITVIKDGQDITSKTSVCQDQQCYIRRQNIYADNNFSITLSEGSATNSSYTVVVENLLLQVAPNGEGKFNISLGDVSLKIERSTIKCSLIFIESSEINLDLVAIEYNNMNINANSSLFIRNSETYNNRQNCAQNTTRFSIDELFKDPSALSSCSGFAPYAQIAGRLFAGSGARKDVTLLYDLNVGALFMPGHTIAHVACAHCAEVHA